MKKILNRLTLLFYKVTRLGKEFKFTLKKNQPTYYIVRRNIRWGTAGFFSNYLYAISHITYAKEQGYIPVVDMENFKTLYSEKKPINGKKMFGSIIFQIMVFLQKKPTLLKILSYQIEYSKYCI